ncbi:hypothetical protein [Oceanobacillus sp. 1P07AA]|uniref:hypothetical protein n=1 Tax=Oceanobacillus sp. 1P07AA TaxID=3132293 RepID=UPI0039A6D2A7
MINWKLIEKYLQVGQNDTLFLGGSSALPWKKSQAEEYDLFLITESISEEFVEKRSDERISEQKRNGFTIVYINTEEVELDIEIWNRKKVDKAIRSFGRGLPSLTQIEENFNYFAGLDRKVGLDLFHNINIGLSQPRLSDNYIRLKEQIDWQRYYAWNRDYHLINVMDGVKGITTSIKGKHKQEAYLKLCWAFDNALDAILFHHGISINRWKWRLRYLKYLPKDFSKVYQSIRFDGLLNSFEDFKQPLEILKDTQNYIETRPTRGGDQYFLRRT